MQHKKYYVAHNWMLTLGVGAERPLRSGAIVEGPLLFPG